MTAGTSLRPESPYDELLLITPDRHIVLSPHYDDMALSLGATIATVTRSGRDVTDLIVFGDEPSGIDLHAFARHHHEAWGLTASEAIAARRAEEADAVRILGASTANLPFHDAIYRRDHYTSDAALFGTPTAAEGNLPAEIARSALRMAMRPAGTAATDSDAVRFYAPLAVGRHVDHQIAFAAAQELHRLGQMVWLYEDLPYAMIGDNLDRRLEEIRTASIEIEPAARVPVTVGWRQKIDAVLAYPSQLQTVFGNYAGVAPVPEAIERALDVYHRQRTVEDAEPVERLWRFVGSSSSPES